MAGLEDTLRSSVPGGNIGKPLMLALPNGRGDARCSAFHPTDPAFEPSLHQHKSLPAGNAILRGRDKGSERALEVQSTDCGDRTRARIPASSGLFALNRKISVYVGLRGGAGRTRTSNQSVIRNLFFRPRILQVVAMDVAKPSPFIGGQIFLRAVHHFTCPQSVKS
jgi:hypothetical protein